MVRVGTSHPFTSSHLHAHAEKSGSKARITIGYRVSSCRITPDFAPFRGFHDGPHCSFAGTCLPCPAFLSFPGYSCLIPVWDSVNISSWGDFFPDD